MNTTSAVEQHYSSANIAERVLAALKAVNGPDAPVTAEALAPIDHFHGRGVLATEELAALLQPRAGERLLDIGCGIGGPARWIAARFGCHVTGIDLTEDFCRAAEALNAATGLSGLVSILHGDALALPFDSNQFDRAYSQNVVMNIPDKLGFYREGLRVLKPGGLLALSNLAAGPAGDPYFPVPWALTAATSFLSTPEQTRAELLAAGFEIISFRDTTETVLAAQAKMLDRLETRGLPTLGVHVVMGEQMKQRQINSARSVRDGRVRPIEALVRKPV